MPIRGSGEADVTAIDRWDEGVGWQSYPDEEMQRASHALATDDGVYLVDPLDGPGVDDLVAAYGDVAGVAVLLDRHLRDADELATRHGVPVTIPSWMTGVASRLDASVQRAGPTLSGIGFELVTLYDAGVWQEAALYRESDGLLYVPEALGTADYFTTGSERVGVHPFVRLLPPTTLRSLSVDRLLVGHGAGLDADAEAAIDDAISNARIRAPSAMLGAAREFFGV